jgi:tetratricopeptide (TPR) repeat protein
MGIQAALLARLLLLPLVFGTWARAERADGPAGERDKSARPGTEPVKDAAYHRRAAVQAMRDEEWDKALKQVKQALKIEPKNTAAHLLAARINRLYGDFPEAQHHLKECKRLYSEAKEDLQLEWLLYRAQTGEIELVEPGLNDLVQKDHPDKSAILEALAAAYHYEMRWPRALKVLNRWLEIEPKNPKILDWRGRVHLSLNSLDAAIADFEGALKLAPQREGPGLVLIDIWIKCNNPAKALEQLKKLKKTKPDLPQLLFAMARCRVLEGKQTEGRKYLERFLAALPNDAEALAYLGKLEAQEGRPAQAEKLLREAIQRNPSDVESSYHLYLALRLTGRTKEAEVVLRAYKDTLKAVERLQVLLGKGLDANPTDPQAPTELGEIYQRLGQPSRAEYWLHGALKRDPDYKGAHRSLAAHYASVNQPAKAEWHRKRAE